MPTLYAGMVGALIALCLVIIGLDSWRTWTARTVTLTADQTETANLARSLAQHAHDTVQAADTVIRGLRERIETGGWSPASLARLQRLMEGRIDGLPAVRGLFIYDAKGDWLATSLHAVPPGVNNGDRPYFRHHQLNTDRSVLIGPPIRSRSDGSWVFIVTRRLDDATGAFAGVVLATISIDALHAFYKTFDIGAEGAVSLFSSNGILFARTNATDAMIGLDLAQSQAYRELITPATTGSFSFVSTLDQVQRIGSYHRVESYPLLVLVAHGVDEVLADWRSDGLYHAALTLGLSTLIVVLGIRFARQFHNRREADHRYRLLADNSNDAITWSSLDGRRADVSPAFETLTGWSPAETLGRTWRDFVHADDHAMLDAIAGRLIAGETGLSAIYRYTRKSGVAIWVEARFHIVPATGSAGAQIVANIRDINDRKEAEDRLAAANLELVVLASTDGLTGLANRHRFDEALTREWQRAAREAQPLSLLLIDADRFKSYNDRYGHPQGDACLQAISAAVQGAARRSSDLVARYGGEELVVLLPGVDENGALSVAEDIRAAVASAATEHLDNWPAQIVTISLGVATRRPHPATGATDAIDLVTAADAALYEAKRNGRNRVASEHDCASPTMPPPVDERQRLQVLAQYERAGALVPSECLDRLARLAAAHFHVPIALVSVVGEASQCFAGRVGIDIASTSRDVSLCALTITGDDVFTVTDTTKDERFLHNPLVTGDPHIRFYAGAPLLSPLGHTLGSICIIDRKPRPPLTPIDKIVLTDLAALAVDCMEQRRLAFIGELVEA